MLNKKRYMKDGAILHLIDTKEQTYVLVPNGWYCELWYKGYVIDAFYNTCVEDYINEHNLTLAFIS